MQLAVDPQTGQVGGQILLHVLERLLAIARFGCYATRGGRPKKKYIPEQVVSHPHWHQFIF